MSIALDYTSRIDPAALKAAGVSDVCRYLSWLYRYGGTTHTTPNPKIIQKPEFDELVAAGIGVTLNWEYDAQDWLGGAAAGTAHAVEAVRQAHALGYPAGCAIIGSADFNMNRTQWTSAARGYAVAFAAGIRAGGYRPGVYGPWDVLTWCRFEAGIDVFWQAGMSTAWSAGRNANPWPGAHLRQRAYLTVGGVQGDRNDILRPDWGQYKGADMTPEEHNALMELLSRMRWVDPRVAALLDMAPTYTDQGGKSHPAQAVTTLNAAATQPAPVALTDADLQAIIAGLAAHVDDKLNQVLARLTAAGQALDG